MASASALANAFANPCNEAASSTLRLPLASTSSSLQFFFAGVAGVAATAAVVSPVTDVVAGVAGVAGVAAF